MIRDGDGKDAEELASSLCRYYEARNREDMDRLPRVTRENVLILKYYSFENYFLDPKIMEKIGVIKSEDDFYEILLKKWNEYLYKLKSGQHLTEMIGHALKNTTDIREHNIWKKSVSVSADIIYMISFTEDSVKTKLKSSNPI